MRKTLLIAATAARLCLGTADAGWNGHWYELSHTAEDALSALNRQEAQDSDLARACAEEGISIQRCDEATLESTAQEHRRQTGRGSCPGGHVYPREGYVCLDKYYPSDNVRR